MLRSYSRRGSIQDAKIRSEAPTEAPCANRTGVSWSAPFSQMRQKQQQQQQYALAHVFQKRYAFNSDTSAALLEFAMLTLSMIQLELVFRSPYWVRCSSSKL